MIKEIFLGYANQYETITLVTIAIIILLSGICAYLKNEKYEQEFYQLGAGSRTKLGLGSVSNWESHVNSEIVDMGAELKFLVNPVKAKPKKLTKKQAIRLKTKRARKSRKQSK